MTMRKILFSLAILAVTATGCQTNRGSSVDPITGEVIPAAASGLSPSGQQRFSDVPLPAGTKVDSDRSFVYESGAVQIGRMVYTIREKVNPVAQFYIRESPNFGWNLDSVLEADGTQLLMTKPDKRLIVHIKDIGWMKGGTRIVVQMIPVDAQITSSRPISSSAPTLRPLD
jgi:hypothetical protein